MADKTQTAMPGLLPCPFCKSQDARVFNHPDEHGRASFGVQCGGSDCAICGPERGTETDAIAAWNYRAAQPSRQPTPQEQAQRGTMNELEMTDREAALCDWHGANGFLNGWNAGIDGNEEALSANWRMKAEALRVLKSTATPPSPDPAKYDISNAPQVYFADTLNASQKQAAQPSDLYNLSEGVEVSPWLWPNVAWLPIESAPKDGTLLRLLVQFDDNATEDSTEPCPTIGVNTFGHSGEEVWRFAGWDWSHDCFTEGSGTPIGWLPLLDYAQPAQQVEGAGTPVYFVKTTPGGNGWYEVDKNRYDAEEESLRRVLLSSSATALSSAPSEQDKVDAERYRLLKASDWYIGPEYDANEAGGIVGYENHNAGDLDSAVSARAAQEKQGGERG